MEPEVITITVWLKDGIGSDIKQVAETIVHNMKWYDEHDSDDLPLAGDIEKVEYEIISAKELG